MGFLVAILREFITMGSRGKLMIMREMHLSYKMLRKHKSQRKTFGLQTTMANFLRYLSSQVSSLS